MSLSMLLSLHCDLHLHTQEPGKEPVDCSACGSSGFPISGDLNLLDTTIMTSDARYIILVEKVYSLTNQGHNIIIHISHC